MFEFDYEVQFKPDNTIIAARFYYEDNAIKVWKYYCGANECEYYESEWLKLNNNNEIDWTDRAVNSLGLTREIMIDIEALVERMLKLQLFLG